VISSANRVGVDESISFWGRPPRSSPRPVRRCSALRCTTKACSSWTSRPADIRREADRPAAPARRAAGAQRSRAAADRRGAIGPGRRFDRRPGRRAGPRCRAGPAAIRVDRVPTPPTDGPAGRPGSVTVGDPAPSAPFELPVELAIDTNVRSTRHPPSSSGASWSRQASSGPCSGCRAGSIRRVRGQSDRGGDRPRNACSRSCSRTAARRPRHAPTAESVVSALGWRQRAGRDHGHGRRLLRGPVSCPVRVAGTVSMPAPLPARQPGRADADGPCCTTDR